MAKWALVDPAPAAAVQQESQEPSQQSQQQQNYGSTDTNTNVTTAPTVAADLEQPSVEVVQEVSQQPEQLVVTQQPQQTSQEEGVPAAGAAGTVTTVTVVDSAVQPQIVPQQQIAQQQQPPAAGTTITINPGAPQVPAEQQPLMQSFHTNPVAGSYFVDNPAATAAFAQYQAEQQRQREEAAAKNKTCLIVVIVVLLCVLCIGGGGLGCYFGGFIGGDDGFFESDDVMTTNKEADRAVRVIYYNDVDPDSYKYWKTSSYDIKCRQDEIISMKCSPKEFIEYRKELKAICGYLNANQGLNTKSPALIIGFLKKMKNEKPVNAYKYGEYVAALREVYDESKYSFNGLTIEGVLDRIGWMSDTHPNIFFAGADAFLAWKNCFKEVFSETTNRDTYGGYLIDYQSRDAEFVIFKTRWIADPPNPRFVLDARTWKQWKSVLKNLYSDLQTYDYTYSRQGWKTITDHIDTLAGLGIQPYEFNNRWYSCKIRYEDWRTLTVPQAINVVRNTR